MLSGFVGTKLGMTQIFGANGELIPVTVVEATPCTVVQVRTKQLDGYEAVQDRKSTRLNSSHRT